MQPIDSTATAAVLPLCMRSVTKRYANRTVVQALDLEIARGEIVTLLGPNGAGKSTTLALALGFEQPDEGTVLVSGHNLRSAAQQARSQIAYVPENVHLYPLLTGLENLEYFAALADLSTTLQERRDALLQAGLPVEAHRRQLRHYSKGMRQKTAIALAMLRRSSLLLLDEPTSGLDPGTTEEFHLLLERTARRGVAVLMVTHELTRAVEIADRVLVLKAGRIAASFGPRPISPEKVRAHYLTLTEEA